MNLLLRPPRRERKAMNAEDQERTLLPAWVYWPQNFVINVYNLFVEEIFGNDKLGIGRYFIFFSFILLLFTDKSWQHLKQKFTYFMVPMIVLYAFMSLFGTVRKREIRVKKPKKKEATRSNTRRSWMFYGVMGGLLFAAMFFITKAVHSLMGL